MTRLLEEDVVAGGRDDKQTEDDYDYDDDKLYNNI